MTHSFDPSQVTRDVRQNASAFLANRVHVAHASADSASLAAMSSAFLSASDSLLLSMSQDLSSITGNSSSLNGARSQAGLAAESASLTSSFYDSMSIIALSSVADSLEGEDGVNMASDNFQVNLRLI
jgi:hypothetical protein